VARAKKREKRELGHTRTDSPNLRVCLDTKGKREGTSIVDEEGGKED